jgi:hypothetical protein
LLDDIERRCHVVRQLIEHVQEIAVSLWFAFVCRRIEQSVSATLSDEALRASWQFGVKSRASNVPVGHVAVQAACELDPTRQPCLQRAAEIWDASES